MYDGIIREIARSREKTKQAVTDRDRALYLARQIYWLLELARQALADACLAFDQFYPPYLEHANRIAWFEGDRNYYVRRKAEVEEFGRTLRDLESRVRDMLNRAEALLKELE